MVAMTPPMLAAIMACVAACEARLRERDAGAKDDEVRRLRREDMQRLQLQQLRLRLRALLRPMLLGAGRHVLRLRPHEVRGMREAAPPGEVPM